MGATSPHSRNASIKNAVLSEGLSRKAAEKIILTVLSTEFLRRC